MSLTLDQTIPTPCPAPKHLQGLVALPTPQIGLKIAPSRGFKSRRITRGGAAGWDPTLDIFDEVAPNGTRDVNEKQILQSEGIMAQEQTPMCYSANMRKRRTLTLASPQHQVTCARDATVDLKLPTPDQSTIQTDEARKARRRTIYIPTEDTTMLTIHPGASLREQARRPRGLRRSDIFLDLAALDEGEDTSSAIIDNPQELRDPHVQKRALGAAPRRAPLGRSQRITQVNSIVHDVAGTGGGKENLPPGWDVGSAKKNASLIRSKRVLEEAGITRPVKTCTPAQTRSTSMMLDTRPQHAKSRVSNATSMKPSPVLVQRKSPRIEIFSNASRDSTVQKNPASQTRPSSELVQLLDSKSSMTRSPAITRSPNDPPYSSLHAVPRQRLSSAPSASTQHQTAESQYPILRENIVMPALYTSDYLTSQEVALSQVINDIFVKAGHSNQASKSYLTLRKEMMCLHNTENTVQLQERLQASLRFGALSISKMALEKVSHVKDDLAQRQGYLDLWTRTYDLELLRAATEVVIGREISKTARLLESPRSSVKSYNTETVSAQRQTKVVQAFLCTFLLRNEDAPKGHDASVTKATDNNNDTSSPAWLWRRTVVRSLLLIRLLDQFAAVNANTSNALCLFQTSSPHKTSTSMLQAIGTVLIPSIGNPTRILNHINYTLGYVQQPLQEYMYRVTNPAIDFRGGLLLTRLVELLLPSLTNFKAAVINNTSPAAHSHHLTNMIHCPAPTRNHKLYNVRIALSAIQTHSRNRHSALQSILAALKPEDIVDGHREKTLTLLWTLMLECGGLDMLIARDVLAAEVLRLMGKARTEQDNDREVDIVASNCRETGYNKHDHFSTQDLLLKWAQQCLVNCHTPSIHLTNPKDIDITASLTNPNTRNTIYEAIAATYANAQSYPGPEIEKPTPTSTPAQQLLKRAGYHDSKFLALYSCLARDKDKDKGELNLLQTKETGVALLAVLARVVLFGV